MPDLEKRLIATLDEINASNGEKDYILNALYLLQEKHKCTYYHSLRVGLYCEKSAKPFNLERKTMLFSGLLHDIGKLMIDTSLLEKRQGFNEMDFENIKKHVDYGYFLVAERFKLIGEILLRHHCFGKNPYPNPLPITGYKLKDSEKEKIEHCAKILSIVDAYDAMLHRHNDHVCSYAKTNKERKDILIAEHPSIKEIIISLYEHKIIGSQ